MSIKIGKEYIIDHSRKGPFIGKILKDNGEWITVKITKGRAHHMSMMNVSSGLPGETITIRKKFCLFKEVK